MAEVNHFYAEQTTLQTHTGSTYGTMLTISGSSLAADTKYLVIAKAVFGGDGANDIFRMAVASNHDGNLGTDSLYVLEPMSSTQGDGVGYFFVGTFTTHASLSYDVELRLEIPDTSTTAWADQMSLLLIDLDDLGTDNYAEASDAGGGGLTTTWAPTATIDGTTQLDGSTEYLVLGCQRILVDDNKTEFESALFVDSGNSRSYHQAEGEDTSEARLVGHMGAVTTAASPDDIYITNAAEASNDYDEGVSYLIAIKTSAFDSFDYSYDAGGTSVTSTETTLTATGAFTPTAGDFLILGRWNYTEAGNADGMTASVYDNTLGTTEVMSGDNGVYQSQVWDSQDAESANVMAVQTWTATSRNLTIKGKSASATLTSYGEFVAYLSLELASTGTTYTETNRSASFDATCDSTDTADLSDTGLSAQADMTTAHTDTSDMTDVGRSALVELTAASTEGLAYTETGRTALFDATCTSTDTWSALDNRSALVDHTAAHTDTANLVDQALAALTDYTTDSTDARSMDETGLSALVDYTTDSTDTYTPAGTNYDETGRAAVVDLTTDGTDNVGFLDAVAAAVDYTTAVTDAADFLDNRSATTDFTTASTDDASFTDTAAALVDYTTASTESLSLTENLAAPVDLTTASTDTADFTYNFAALVDLTTTSTDAVSITENLSALCDFTCDSTDTLQTGTTYDETGRAASVDLTVDSTDVAGFLDAVAAAVDYTTTGTDNLSALDNRAATVDVTTASTDVMPLTDSLSALADFSTASTDAMPLTDSLAALVDYTTASTESLTLTDNLAALVDVTSSSTDNAGMVDNRSALVDLTTAESDTLGATDTLSALCDWTTDSTDTVDLSDSLSALVELTAAGEDTHNIAPPQVTLLDADVDATGSNNPYSTASVSPSADSTLLIAVVTRANSSSEVPPGITGGSLTWTQVDSQQHDTSGVLTWIHVFRAETGSSPGSFSVTITCPQDPVGVHWHLVEVANSDLTSNNGVVRSAKNYDDTDTVGTITSTFATTPGSNNTIVSFCSIQESNSTTFTEDTDYTELSKVGPSENEQSATQYKEGSADTTVVGTWASQVGPIGIISVEVKGQVGSNAYDETGRSASFDATTASTDTVDLTDTGKAATVDLTTASTDGQGYALDSLSALVDFTADSTDTLNTGITYDETGRSALVEFTADSTDTLTLGPITYDETGRSALVELTAQVRIAQLDLEWPATSSIASEAGSSSLGTSGATTTLGGSGGTSTMGASGADSEI